MMKLDRLIYENLEQELDAITVYHQSRSKEDAELIIKNGFDRNEIRGGKAEGYGIGTFVNKKHGLSNMYGEYVIVIEIPASAIVNHTIVIPKPGITARDLNIPDPILNNLHIKYKNSRSTWNQIMELDSSILKEEDKFKFEKHEDYDGSSVSGFLGIDKQIDNGNSKIKAIAWDGRFGAGIPLLHIWDLTIAVPIKYIKI